MLIKLVNLNIWHGGGYLWDPILAYLQKEKPDLITLQETFTSEGLTVHPYLQTTTSLQRILKYPHAEFSPECFLEFKGHHVSCGNAILSKFPLANKQISWLHGNEPREVEDTPEHWPNLPRNILHCKIDISGKSYNLMNLHGVWAPDSNETELQKIMGRRIAEYLEGKEDIILSGDFNVNERSEAIRSVEKHVVNLFKGERISSFNMNHKSNPGYATAVVDFVFASPGIEVIDHYTAEADVSDHQSQVVVFDL